MKFGFLNPLAVALLVAPIPVNSAMILDTGEPEGVVYSATANSRAVQFQLASPVTITGIEALLNSAADDRTAIFSVYSDGGGLPGATIFSTPFALRAATAPGEWQGPTGLNWLLGAGTYWVAGEASPRGAPVVSWSLCRPIDFPVSPGLEDECVLPNPAPKEAGLTPVGGVLVWGERFADSAWRIHGTVHEVPEPAGLALLGLGLAGLWLNRRRHVA